MYDKNGEPHKAIDLKKVGSQSESQGAGVDERRQGKR